MELNNEVLKCGECLVDEDGTLHSYVGGSLALDFLRIRVIKYDGKLYYHKMVNGNVVDFKELK